MPMFREQTGSSELPYHRTCPEKRTEPVYTHFKRPLPYADISDYIRAWPDKLVSFVAERLCDDDMAPFARELYEYICCADRDGPDFEEWRKT